MKDRIKQIRLGLKMSQKDFAREIDVVQQQLSKYERGENKPSTEFLIKLIEKMDVNINWLLTGYGNMFNSAELGNENAKSVEIKYYESPKISDTIKNPVVESIWLDKNMVNNIWRKDEKNLRIIQMPGDYMQGGYNDFSISNSDIVVVDIKSTNVSLSGIYAYTTQNNEFIFIKSIQRVADGSLMFNVFNDKYQSVVYREEELKKIDFKVIGRVIKNLSKCIY